MLAETKHTSLRLAAAVLLVFTLLTACVSKSTKVQEKIDLGQKYLTELNYTEAVASFTEAIQLDPDSIPAYMGRAEAYVGLEQYPEAKADYTTAIEKAADQPYTQAQAYVGRAEVNELTEELQDAESDYEAAQELLEAEDVAEKKPVEDDVLTALKKKILYARAVLCTKLGLYDGAVTSYEKLTALGEDVAEEHTRVLNAALWAISTTQDLGAANQWLKTHDLPQGDEMAEVIQRAEKPMEISAWADQPYTAINEIRSENEVPKYAEYYDFKYVRDWVKENQADFQTLLENGFEIRYSHSGHGMTAVYRGETSWPEENANLTETEAFLKAYRNENSKMEAVSDFWADTVYVYNGGYSGKLRVGEGCWGILNGSADEWEKAFYQWENDAPAGGFLKKETAVCKQRWDHGEERVSTIYYSIGGTSIEITETFKHDNEGQPYAVNHFYGVLPAPLLELKRTTYGVAFVLPAGTMVENYDGHYDGRLNGKIAIESGKTYPISFSRSVGSCMLEYEGR